MDAERVAKLIEIGEDHATVAQLQAAAALIMPDFPDNGCALFLTLLLNRAGIEVPLTKMTDRLVKALEKRGWIRVTCGTQLAGDVGVTRDSTPPDGADHGYLVMEVFDEDLMMVLDNQLQVPHRRRANGEGRTPTAFFLRAP